MRGSLRILHQLASLKLALVILLALGAGVLTAYLSEVRTTWALVVPLALLAINLSAAIITNASFHRQKGLLVFHIALVAIVLLIAIGRLTYLRGTLELTNGVLFDGSLTSVEAGPWHLGRLRDIKFYQDGFEIDYLPGTPNQGFGTDKKQETTAQVSPAAASEPVVTDTIGARRGATRNRVHWLDKKGEWQSAVVGDNEPLVIYGYNFFTTSNKGFSPLFAWTPNGGTPVTGAINLPAYPSNEFKQYLEWTPPGSNLKLWTQLQFDDVIINPYKPSKFRLPERHKIIIRQGNDRHELKVGDSIKFPEGTLTYQELTAWMGYNVDHDWTIGWLLAACVVAMLSLTWHFWRKFAARPWQTDEDNS